MIVRRYMLKYCRINLWLCIQNSKLLWNIKVSPLAFDLNNKIRIWSPTGLLRMILYQVWNKFIKANYRISFFFFLYKPSSYFISLITIAYSQCKVVTHLLSRKWPKCMRFLFWVGTSLRLNALFHSALVLNIILIF